MCTGETLPYITPDGYNAFLGQDSVEFSCVVPNETFSVLWVINGQPLDIVGEQMGIIAQFRESDMTYVVTVEARAESDNITLECLAVFLDALPARSEEILLHIQGDHKHVWTRN